MSEDPKEKINRIRAKLNQLSKINPNTYLSDRQLEKITQKLQEKRKGIATITQSDHHKGIFERNPKKTTISLVKKAQDTEIIMGNYFKKIELKKQQSANNQSVKRQKENQNIGINPTVTKVNDVNNTQITQQSFARDHQTIKEQQIISAQKMNFNIKQTSHSQDHTTSSTPQINNTPIIFQSKEIKNEAIVVNDSPREDKSKISVLNPFHAKKKAQNQTYQNFEQFINQDFTKHPQNNPFLISQQKKKEIQYQKPKIKRNEQNLSLQENATKIKRFNLIQPTFQPLKKTSSQPAPVSISAANKNNSPPSIFAKNDCSLNLNPSNNLSKTQNLKIANERRQNISIRQQKSIFNKKSPIAKNIVLSKPLSSISQSVSEHQSAQDESALKTPRQRKIPVFQEHKINHNLVQFLKSIDQSQDSVEQIPKNEYKQPQKVNIFLSNIRKDNNQPGTINLFQNASKATEEKIHTNNTSITPAINIFTGLVNKSKNIFSQPNPETKTNEAKQNIFTKMTTSDNIFGKPNFQITQKNEEENEQIEDNASESSNQLIQDEDIADPNLSTVKYDYEKPDLIFKEPSNKFRCGNGQNSLLENLMISLEKITNTEDVLLIGRMANKLVSFNGKLLKNITKIRSLNNSPKNVEIAKILSIMPDKANELAILRIQFKDSEVGKRFISQVQKVIN